MMAPITTILLFQSLLISAAIAKVHHLFTGNLGLPASLHALEFDDEALTLVKTRTVVADSSHAWIAFDHKKHNIYGASLSAKRIASYSIHANYTLRLDHSLEATGACLNQSSAFVLPSSRPPYFAYTASWPGPNGCGMALAVHPNGTLSNVTQSWKYEAASGIHGLAFGPGDQLLYSADLSADKIWTHSVQNDGQVSLVSKLDVSKLGMHPRHLAAHPGGKYLYILMEHENTLVEYAVDEDTGLPRKEDTKNYSLLPKGKNSSGYWSAEVILSRSKSLLWASARANSGTNYTGYISCFELHDGGRIKEQLFMVPTTTVGGIANQVSPATFSDEWMALSDFPNGYVEIWQVKMSLKGNRTTAVPIAKVDIGDGGCCANTIWYD